MSSSPGTRIKGPEWIPLAKLLTDDTLFDNPATEQIGLCRSLGVGPLRTQGHGDAAEVPHLSRSHPPAQSARTTTIARLGNLDRLDLDLRNHARRL